MLSISATGLAWIRSSLIQARTTSPSSASLPSLTACPSWTTGRGMSAIASTAPSLLCSHHICCRIAAQLMYSSRCCAARCRFTSKKRLPSTTRHWCSALPDANGRIQPSVQKSCEPVLLSEHRTVLAQRSYQRHQVLRGCAHFSLVPTFLHGRSGAVPRLWGYWARRSSASNLCRHPSSIRFSN